VVADCDAALKLDPAYIKALKRRAAAREALERDEEAIRDYTAVTLLEAFEPPKKVAPGKENETGEQLERVIKKTADKQAKELLRTRPPQLPSTTFILAYLDAFRPHASPALPENPNTADEVLVRAFQALDAQDYAHAFTLAQEALTQGLSPEWKDGKAEALNLRGTFKSVTRLRSAMAFVSSTDLSFACANHQVPHQRPRRRQGRL
jgi:import receptor subunit TOM70